LWQWSQIPVAKEFVTEQIMTLNITCYLDLELDPGLFGVEELLDTVNILYKQLHNDLYVRKPPEIYSASRRAEAFVRLNARVSAWLTAWPELTQETIALSVREDQNYNSSERRTLDSYQAQLQKHYYQMLRSHSSIYDQLTNDLMEYYNDLTLDEFARLRAIIANSESRLGIQESDYLQGPVTKLLRLIREQAHDDLFVRMPPRYWSVDLMPKILALVNEALPAYDFPFRISKVPVAGDCAICWDEFGKEVKEPEDLLPLHDLRGEATPVLKHDVAVLRCGHSYHVGCAFEWYNSCKDIEMICPLCREPF